MIFDNFFYFIFLFVKKIKIVGCEAEKTKKGPKNGIKKIFRIRIAFFSKKKK